ncbi:hypothetical protein LTS10_001993 [Elasticomyces elasticus]|nr:hypothetical protein LTS10_001993 [Elasticomyces elasticus]
MASIFTYESDPPKVTSPWLQLAGFADSEEAQHSPLTRNGGSNALPRLEAEPQEGPVEYKLHLLLRPRRKFKSTSTGNSTLSPGQRKFGLNIPNRSTSVSALESGNTSGSETPPSASTQMTRQHRLEQLTTQLLWRLQQSSPHHTSSATNIILPSLPEALPELQAPQQPARLLHGLEESQGALYEIGVADDGTLVGLAQDELEESMNNLRAMAACLGCMVEITRTETVGDCEWIEEVSAGVGRKQRQIRRTGRLVVAEAFVKPYLQATSPAVRPHTGPQQQIITSEASNGNLSTATEQLRVTLTGPTMCGKSSLLGTLTTSTLDNGRGKSRLSMLKHRHEITSGVTSSVTSELLGYQDSVSGVEVINYASENVASWIDMHVAAAESRLVFVSDSAGHPRYRRTTVRSLVGWAPHWTLLCVPADDTEDTAGTLSKVLDALKGAGRRAAIIPNAPTPNNAADGALQSVGFEEIETAYNAALPLLNNPLDAVPIVLTSAVNGTGIRNLHALLHELPLPNPTRSEPSGVIFHIEDIYGKPAGMDGITVVSGLLRSGRISVGDSLTIGPFSAHDQFDDSEDSDERPRRRHSSLPTSRSFPGALRDSHLAPPRFLLPGQEWRTVEVSSIRNLRLPVHSLLADQVGTLAIRLENADGNDITSSALARIRKGMVLATSQPLAVRTFVAQFKREDLEPLAVGNHVVVYIASVRASARVISARAQDSPTMHFNGHIDPFGFDDMAEALDDTQTSVAGAITASELLVTFKLDAAKEYIAVGEQVLVMPGGGPGLYGGHERGEKGVAGLEGFVGIVMEIFG